MKLCHIMIIAVAGSLASVQASSADQRPISTDGSNPKTWDTKTDGPVAAPGNHQIIFENENIRIMSVTVLPGTKEPYHAHMKCSVLVFDSPAKITDYNKDGAATSRVLWAAIPWQGEDAPKNVPFVGLQPPQAVHSIANNDTHPLHLTRIEMKKGCEAPSK